MDVPAIAPQAVDNGTVILWAVGVLMVVVGLIGKALWSKMVTNEDNLRAAMKDAYEKHENAQKRIENLQGGVIMEQHKTQLQTNLALERSANALDKNAEAQAKLAASIDALLSRQEDQAPRKR